MGFSIRHEIRAMIDDQYSYIVGLINAYPKLSEDWRNEQRDRFKAIAKESSDGDEEIERDIYNQFVNGLDNSYFEESIFNNSIFLMVFSYYEGIINTIAVKENIVVLTKKGKSKKEPNVEELISQIEEAKGFVFSIESKKKLKCILILRKLRNYITHNNGALGSEKEKDAVRLIRRIKGVDIYDGAVVVHDLTFILDLLNVIKYVLDELSLKLYYKTEIFKMN